MPIANMPVETSIAQFRSAVAAEMTGWLNAAKPGDFQAVELRVHKLARGLADAIAAFVLQQRCTDLAFSTECVKAARATGRYRSNGSRETKVTFLGGHTYSVTAPYMTAVRNGRHRRPKPALLPTLVALGVWWRTSPALADEIAYQITEHGSLRDGRASLQRRGIQLEYKRTLTFFQRFSRRAVEQRKKWLQDVLAKPSSTERGPLAGHRVMVAVDGGRLRERVQKPGRRKANGHHAFDAPWREPRQLVISVLDNRGRPAERFCPLFDATLGDADDLFLLLWAYLDALGAKDAKQLIVVADGAEWIWRRVPLLALALGQLDTCISVIDYSHAVSTLHTIASYCSGWSDKRRNRWTNQAETLLYNGDIEGVAAKIRDLAGGRRAKKILSHLGYFVGNAERMRYPELRRRRLPQGSGIVESAIRRVINMRLKSAGKFWLHDNAEGMLHLRSYLKAGHWDHLTRRTLQAAIPWAHEPDQFVPPLEKAA
jgi:hypothetical protein